MRAARLHEYDADPSQALSIESIDRPEPTAGDDVLVCVEAAGICQTDNHILQGGLDDMVTLPHVPGHENAGTVAAVGPDVTTVAEGDRVVAMGAVSCGSCRPCRLGEDYHCRDLEIAGITRPGGFAEYLVVPERSLVRTESDPVTAAAFGDAGLTSYSAAKRAAARLAPGDVALVNGIGGLGHVGLQNLHALTPATLIAVDVRPEAVSLADDLGADVAVDASEEDVGAVVDELTNGRGVDQVIDFAGTVASFETSLSALGVGGDLNVVGYGSTVELPLKQLTTRDVSLVGNRVGNYAEFQEFVALADGDHVDVVTETFDLANITDAAERLAGGDVVGRAVITP